MQQQVAAGVRGIAQGEIARRDHENQVASGIEAALLAIEGAVGAGLAGDTLHFDRNGVDQQTGIFRQIQAAPLGAASQRRDIDFQRVERLADGAAGRHAQAVGQHIDAAVTGAILIEDGSTGQQGRVAAARVQPFQREIAADGIDHDVGVAGDQIGSVGHDDMAAGHQIERLALGAVGDVGIAEQISTGVEAGMARGIADGGAQDQVGPRSTGLQQQVARRRDGAAGQGGDASSQGGQRQRAGADDTIETGVGHRADGGVARHPADGDAARVADFDGVGFIQEQSAATGHQRGQAIDRQLQVLRRGADTVARGEAGGHDAQGVAGKVGIDAAAVGQSARGHADGIAAAQAAHGHGARRGVTDVAGRDGIGTVVHGDAAAGLHVQAGATGDVRLLGELATGAEAGCRATADGVVQRHGARRLQQELAAGRDVIADRQIAAVDQQDQVAAGGKTGLLAIGRAARGGISGDPLCFNGEAVHDQAGALAEECATGCRLRGQGGGGDFQMIERGADGIARIQAHAGGGEVVLAVAEAFLIDQAAGKGGERHVRRTRADVFDGDVTRRGQQHDIAIVAEDVGAILHGDVTARHDVDGLAVAAGGDVGVGDLQQVTPGIEAGVAGRDADIRAQGDVGTRAHGLHQGIPCRRDGGGIADVARGGGHDQGGTAGQGRAQGDVGPAPHRLQHSGAAGVDPAGGEAGDVSRGGAQGQRAAGGDGGAQGDVRIGAGGGDPGIAGGVDHAGGEAGDVTGVAADVQRTATADGGPQGHGRAGAATGDRGGASGRDGAGRQRRDGTRRGAQRQGATTDELALGGIGNDAQGDAVARDPLDRDGRCQTDRDIACIGEEQASRPRHATQGGDFGLQAVGLSSDGRAGGKTQVASVDIGEGLVVVKDGRARDQADIAPTRLSG